MQCKKQITAFHPVLILIHLTTVYFPVKWIGFLYCQIVWIFFIFRQYEVNSLILLLFHFELLMNTKNLHCSKKRIFFKNPKSIILFIIQKNHKSMLLRINCIIISLFGDEILCMIYQIIKKSSVTLHYSYFYKTSREFSFVFFTYIWNSGEYPFKRIGSITAL